MIGFTPRFAKWWDRFQIWKMDVQISNLQNEINFEICRMRESIFMFKESGIHFKINKTRGFTASLVKWWDWFQTWKIRDLKFAIWGNQFWNLYNAGVNFHGKTEGVTFTVLRTSSIFKFAKMLYESLFKIAKWESMLKF